ncbi:hypothetical protein [Bifidobacterium tissieri]|uniref:hypothetical protein n=1 Tax=Bifidobacterium tissieri TaxID=1630162 RepID=UPI001238972D|nr:hypothetical protein [Bifidobacterium tissieri]KAA8832582.1 hypothetical protein EM849_03490 [Bifidobacterium tissieri]
MSDIEQSDRDSFRWRVRDDGDHVTVSTVVTRQIELLSMKRSGEGWMIAIGPNGNWTRPYDAETLRTIAETILKTINTNPDADN